MAEYVERMKVLALGYWHGKHPDFDNPCPDGVDAVDVSDIESITAADVVEVVRCKDCKYFLPPTKDGFTACSYMKGGGITAPKPNDFCSYGERKE